MKYIKNRDNNTIIGEGNIKILVNNTPYLKFKVNNVEDNTKLQLPRFYYLGYELIDSKGNKYKYYEDKYGLINVNLSNGVYELKYVGTNLYKITVVLKTLLIIFLIYILRKWVKEYIENNKKAI